MAARSAEGGALRIISYNVLEGFRGAPERQRRVADWLARQRPDVVALEELNDYTEDRLRQEAAAWGHPCAALLKLTGYATGLTSRRPIVALERIVAGYHHGVLRGQTAGLTFFVVHLSPHSLEMRCQEAAQLVAVMRPLLARAEPVIVLGDFNDTSPLDADYYAAKDDLQRREAGLPDGAAAGRPDGLATAGLPVRGDAAIPPRNHDAVATFLDAGLVDLVRRHHSGPLPPMSCDTLLGKPAGTRRESLVRGQRRIDYIMASPALAAGSLSANIVNDASMDLLSDHYPVVADLAWHPPEPDQT